MKRNATLVCICLVPKVFVRNDVMTSEESLMIFPLSRNDLAMQ